MGIAGNNFINRLSRSPDCEQVLTIYDGVKTSDLPFPHFWLLPKVDHIALG